MVKELKSCFIKRTIRTNSKVGQNINSSYANMIFFTLHLLILMDLQVKFGMVNNIK